MVHRPGSVKTLLAFRCSSGDQLLSFPLPGSTKISIQYVPVLLLTFPFPTSSPSLNFAAAPSRAQAEIDAPGAAFAAVSVALPVPITVSRVFLHRRRRVGGYGVRPAGGAREQRHRTSQGAPEIPARPGERVGGGEGYRSEAQGRGLLGRSLSALAVFFLFFSTPIPQGIMLVFVFVPVFPTRGPTRFLIAPHSAGLRLYDAACTASTEAFLTL